MIMHELYNCASPWSSYVQSQHQPNVQAFALLVRYVMSNEQGMAFLGLLQIQAAVDRLGPVLDTVGWQSVVRTLSVASCTDHLLTVRVTACILSVYVIVSRHTPCACFCWHHHC